MNKKQKRLFFVGAVLAVSALAAGAVLTGLRTSVSYFFTPTDLAAAIASPSGGPSGPIRIGGLVAAGSVAYPEGETAMVEFAIEDEFAETKVVFAGVLPDLFREGQGVVVQGRLADSGAVVADEVLAKHDETYMPREVADALKEQGRWRDGED